MKIFLLITAAITTLVASAFILTEVLYKKAIKGM